MKSVLYLVAFLCLLSLLMSIQSPPSGAQRLLPDGLTERKAAASQNKKQSEAAFEEDIGRRKREAADHKFEPLPGPENGSDAEPVITDPLSHSAKRFSEKGVNARSDIGRSMALIQAFDALKEKAQSQGSVRVIVGLRADFQPEGNLAKATDVVQQRARIASVQELLVQKMPGIVAGSLKRFEFIPYMALETNAAGVDHLRASEDVVSITEDIPLPATLAESVPLIGAPTAWAAGFSGAGQVVAILDTGVDKTHPFLAGKVVSEACFSTSSFTQSSSSVCPAGAQESTSLGSGVNCTVSGCDHGTHVAGIAAGKGTSFSGVARDANIIAIQVFSRFDSFQACSSSGSPPCVLSFVSDQIKGLERVFALRSSFNIAAVNMSLGGGQFSSNCDSEPQKAIIDSLRSVNIATVIASGNSSFKSALGSPACISSAISVGSTGDGSGATTLDTVSSFSNSASFLNLLAPGNLIRSSVPGGGFANFQGTSMAAPHVTGAWAVLKSKQPSATVTAVYTALRDTGLPVTDINGITKPRIRVDEAVNALGGGGGGGGGCGAPTAISFGQTINGSLASTDCRFPTSGDHFSDAYTFSGTAGQLVSISMSSTAFDTFLHLIGPNGAVVATDDDGGGGANSRIPASTGFLTLPSTGTYTIQATSFSANTAGIYSLTLNTQAPGGCTSSTSIAFGQTINGTLSTSDCRLPDNSFFDAYTFNGTTGQQIAVSLSSTSFDTFLFLRRPDGTVLAQDDDGGGGTNSRIPLTSGFLTLPTTGVYTIIATSFSASTTGTYALTLSTQTANCPSTPIAVGQTINGTLSISDCRLSDDSLFDSYTFSGTAGQSISISMTSATIDTYLLFFRPDGTLLAEDDDGGTGLNSRIPPDTGTLTLPVTGTYKIFANSFAANTTGSYSLTLSGTTPVTCSSTAITLGQTINGTLSTSDCRLSDNSFFDSYTFNGTAGQQIAVEMSSPNFDTFLFLLGPDGLVVDDDDGGDGFNSRIPAETGFFTLPSSGSYTILTNSFAPNITGNYTLSLLRGQTGCSFTINPGSQSFAFGGGSGSFSVSSGTGCGWSAISNASWITISSGFNGSGNGTVNFSVAANNTQAERSATIVAAGRVFTVSQTSNTASTVQFATTGTSVNESAGKVDIPVTRTGNTFNSATFDFATADGSADRRKDYTQARGTLTFAPGETIKIITLLITDDVFAESPETLTLTLSNPIGTSVGSPGATTVTIVSNDSVTGPNPVDWSSSFNSTFFVRQHYMDFLNRDPDPSGLAFWVNEIESCGPNQQCREAKRLNVSAAFFLSIEFQETGYLVCRIYKAAFGDATSPNVVGTVPIIRLDEFLPDSQRIGSGVQVGIGDWQAQLEANKVAFIAEFVQRQRFLTAFPLTMTPTQFVDKLNLNAGSVLSATERTQLINDLTANNTIAGRAGVLRRVAENQVLNQREFNRVFVLMQYYGYLRRNPDDPQDTNFAGWKFWLDKLNQFNGNFVNAEMVKAFLTSIEYKQRFGP
jgi:subtilisin family serine protease